MGESGAGAVAALGLQRSSTNPPLQSAPVESQMQTVAAGPGSSGSGTNMVPRQVAMGEDANQQATAGASFDRKRLTGYQQRKLRRQALHETKRLVAPQLLRLLWREEWPPRDEMVREGMRDPKRPKPTRLSENTQLSGVGLSAAQRTNPLTVIVADDGYLESVLLPEKFKLFRKATLHALDKEPARNWPRFETSFCQKMRRPPSARRRPGSSGNRRTRVSFCCVWRGSTPH